MHEHPDSVLITERLLAEAETTFTSHWPAETTYNRQLFFDWHCQDQCHVCYLSLQKSEQIPIKAKRSVASILAEAHIVRQLRWTPTLVGDIRTHTIKDLREMCRRVCSITEGGLWINAGPISRNDIDIIRPFIEGVIAPIETVNRDAYKEICPKKSITPLLTMLSETTTKRGISLILGAGESLSNLDLLFDFIRNNEIDRVVFNTPMRSTGYTTLPSSFYIARWIAETRINFPKVEIIVAVNPSRPVETSLFLKSGANQLTGFPAISMFNTEAARIIEQESITARRTMKSTLTDMSKVSKMASLNIDNEIKEKINKYLELLGRQK